MMEGFAAREGTWESFIRSVVSVMIEEAEAGHFYGCPFSVLGMEIAFTEPDLAKAFFAGTGKDTSLVSKGPAPVGHRRRAGRIGVALLDDGL